MDMGGHIALDIIGAFCTVERENSAFTKFLTLSTYLLNQYE